MVLSCAFFLERLQHEKGLAMTLRVTVSILLSTLCSCLDQNDNDPLSFSKHVSTTGVVRYQDLEGGFYAIIGDDGVNYDPINLDRSFHQDGRRVRFSGNTDVEIASIHMWGRIIYLTDIQDEINEQPEGGEVL